MPRCFHQLDGESALHQSRDMASGAASARHFASPRKAWGSGVWLRDRSSQAEHLAARTPVDKTPSPIRRCCLSSRESGFTQPIDRSIGMGTATRRGKRQTTPDCEASRPLPRAACMIHGDGR
jgi:hypothetical protein